MPFVYRYGQIDRFWRRTQNGTVVLCIVLNVLQGLPRVFNCWGGEAKGKKLKIPTYLVLKGQSFFFDPSKTPFSGSSTRYTRKKFLKVQKPTSIGVLNYNFTKTWQNLSNMAPLIRTFVISPQKFCSPSQIVWGAKVLLTQYWGWLAPSNWASLGLSHL